MRELKNIQQTLTMQIKQVAQLWQRDRAAVVTAACCAYALKVHCAVVICQAGPAQNMFVYVARLAFFEAGGSLSANI